MNKTVLSILLCLILSIPNVGYSQIEIGDLKIQSIEELMNPNSKYWGKKKMGSYQFNEDISEIWVNSHPLTGLVPKSKHIKQKSVNLQVNPSYDQQEINERLTRQFNEQFGKFASVEFNNPMLQGVPSKSIYKKWVVKDNDESYRILLGNFGQTVRVIINRQDKIPDF